MMLENTMPSTS